MKILIVKTSSLGDIVHAFSVVAYLKKKFPDSQIDWVSEESYVGLVKAHPWISQVFSIQSKKWRSSLFKLAVWKELKAFRAALQHTNYDLIIDLQGNVKSGLVTGLAKGKAKLGFGRATVPEWPNAFFTNQQYNPPFGQNIRADYLHLVQAYFEDFSNFDVVGLQLNISTSEKDFIQTLLASPLLKKGIKILVCPGSIWKNKQLSFETLKEFLKHLSEHYEASFVFAWGSQAEKAIAANFQEIFPYTSLVLDRISLPSLQNLMDCVDLVISMDSLPLHLAATTSTPTFSVFGASRADKYKPLGTKHLAVQGLCPYGKTFQKRCPILRTCPTGACIKEIGVTTLSQAFHPWWINQISKKDGI